MEIFQIHVTMCWLQKECLKTVCKYCFKRCYVSFTFLFYLHCNPSSNIWPLPGSNTAQGEVDLVLGQKEIYIIVFLHISVWLLTRLCEGILGKMESFQKKPPGTFSPAGGLFKHQRTALDLLCFLKSSTIYLYQDI